MGKEDKEPLGSRTPQRKPLNPTKRLIHLGRLPKVGSLESKVETTKFVHIGGVTRQPFGLVKSALGAAVVDAKKTYSISFVGGQVRSLQTDVEYANTVEKVVTAGENTIKILKDSTLWAPSS